MYTVKEIFYTLQGEGANAGRAAVFCRFSGCNLWTGEADRETAICDFCDADFVGRDRMAASSRPAPTGRRGRGDGRSSLETGASSCALAVSPCLQLGAEAVAALHDEGFEVAIETNGTQDAPLGIDWICVSPKAGAPLVLRHGSELKLVFPQPDFGPERFESLDFEHFFLQPMDGPRGREHKGSNRILLGRIRAETQSSDAQALGDSLR
jgi:7-carboxy-7-deazaguanine synthase (Cx14CxxC type)